MFKKDLGTAILVTFMGLFLFPLGTLAEEADSTTLSFTVQEDTVAVQPEVIHLEPNLEEGEFLAMLESEPHATIEIRSDRAPVFSIETDELGMAQTTIPLGSGANTVELIAIDYWGNVSTPTEIQVDLTENLVVFSHQNQSFSFVSGLEESENERVSRTTDEKVYSITQIDDDRSITLYEGDFVNDSDNDHLADAIERVRGDDPYTPTSLFTGDVDILQFGKMVIANGKLFVYGTAPQGVLIHVLLESNSGERSLVWEGVSDVSDTFLVFTPFHQEGEFTLIVQTLDEFGSVLSEQEEGVVIFDDSKETVPLSVDAHYKVDSPVLHTSVFDLNQYAQYGATTLLGPSIDLVFKGTTEPFSEVFILWRGAEEWVLQTVSHPESGAFELKAPSTVMDGNYTTYIYSKDLETNTLSDVVEVYFNVTSSNGDVSSTSWQTMLYLLLIPFLFMFFLKVIRYVHA